MFILTRVFTLPLTSAYQRIPSMFAFNLLMSGKNAFVLHLSDDVCIASLIISIYIFIYMRI